MRDRYINYINFDIQWYKDILLYWPSLLYWNTQLWPSMTLVFVNLIYKELYIVHKTTGKITLLSFPIGFMLNFSSSSPFFRFNHSLGMLVYFIIQSTQQISDPVWSLQPVCRILAHMSFLVTIYSSLHAIDAKTNFLFYHYWISVLRIWCYPIHFTLANTTYYYT